MRLWFVVFILGIGVFSFATNLSTKANPKYCELALVLAMDASSSVDEREYQLQMKGMASALLDPEVQEAIESLGGLYLAAFEWNGRSNQKLIFDWVHLSKPEDSFPLAAILARHERNSTRSPTAIGAALGYAHRLLNKTPLSCTRRVIDVSGDGANNQGIRPSDVYQLYDFDGITVNGLVIKDVYTSPENFYRSPERYYEKHVIRGSGAFIELADGFDDFERAMKRKLLKEIVPGPIGMLEPDRTIR